MRRASTTRMKAKKKVKRRYFYISKIQNIPFCLSVELTDNVCEERSRHFPGPIGLSSKPAIIALMNDNNNRESESSPDSPTQSETARAAALQRMIGELLPLSYDKRLALIETLIKFFGLNLPEIESFSHARASVPISPSRGTSFQFSEEPDAPSPKTFIFSKSPKTDVERVACLAYYLAHYRGTPHFKTKDISALNTESAHRPFSNAAHSVENATKLGYLVPSVKGSKQISASGELFVEALPDREAAKEILELSRQRRGGAGKKDNTKAEKE